MRPAPARLIDERSWRTGKPKIVVLSTFVVHPATHGGQLRCWHLYRHLTDRFDVELLCLGSRQDMASSKVLGEGIVQRVVSRSHEHAELELGWNQRTCFPVDDIVAGLFADRSGAFMATAAAALADAEAVLLAHPFLLEVAERLAPSIPMVYDAHNCEIDLKAQLLAGRNGGAELLARVAALEGRAVRSSVVRTACSSKDAARMAERYGVPVDSFLLVPNGVDLANTPFVTGAERRRNTAQYLASHERATSHRRAHLALFFGSWHLPNIRAGECIIHLAPLLPDVLFVLVGGHTSALHQLHLPTNLALGGVVSDAVRSVLLRSASVGLNPVVVGSGTNLKLVEYLAAGLPVVSTTTGVRGLPIVDGMHARLAEPGRFASVIDEVVSSRDQETMAAAGRVLVEGAYDWGDLAQRLSGAIDDAISPLVPAR